MNGPTVLAVQMGGRHSGDEKLGAVGVRPRVGLWGEQVRRAESESMAGQQWEGSDENSLYDKTKLSEGKKKRLVAHEPHTSRLSLRI